MRKKKKQMVFSEEFIFKLRYLSTPSKFVSNTSWQIVYLSDNQYYVYFPSHHVRGGRKQLGPIIWICPQMQFGVSRVAIFALLVQGFMNCIICVSL